jgi:hypothetical protein
VETWEWRGWCQVSIAGDWAGDFEKVEIFLKIFERSEMLNV